MYDSRLVEKSGGVVRRCTDEDVNSTALAINVSQMRE